MLTNNANASDGALAVNGIVGAAACSFTVTSSKDLTWPIGNLSLSKVPAGGDVLVSQKGIGSLGLTSCPVGITVAYQFDGVPDADVPELFKVTDGVGQATGLAFKIELGNASTKTQMIPNTASSYYATTIVNTSISSLGSKNVYMSLIATGAKTNFTGSVAGVLDTSMTYTILYN